MRRLAADAIIDGRYQVIGHLGTGGMADVYCAHDMQLERKVALKLLHDRFAQDEEFVERFRREASSAAGLQHQYVVSVYDRGEYDGTPYIAMEYVDGRTLKQLVREHGPLDPARAADLTVQILRAARFAHRRGVIHRDFKPQNVIVDDEGRAKVTDFGIARAGASDMTQTGSIMGTAQYLSPEQAQGHAVNARSDLYSIGIILYELLTGRVPFDAESAVTVALKQVSESPYPPSQLNQAVTPELEAIVLRALAKDPADRFADADEFIAALEAAASRIPSAVGHRRRRGRRGIAAGHLAGGRSAAAATATATAAAPRHGRHRACVRSVPRRPTDRCAAEAAAQAALAVDALRCGARRRLDRRDRHGRDARQGRGAEGRRRHDLGRDTAPGGRRLRGRRGARQLRRPAQHRRRAEPGGRRARREGLAGDAEHLRRPALDEGARRRRQGAPRGASAADGGGLRARGEADAVGLRATRPRHRAEAVGRVAGRERLAGDDRDLDGSRAGRDPRRRRQERGRRPQRARGGGAARQRRQEGGRRGRRGDRAVAEPARGARRPDAERS